MKKKLIAVILAPLLALGAFFGISLSATASDYGVGQILAQTNAARQANGLAPLNLNGGMSSVAYNWSAQQYANGAMSHNPNYASEIPGGWTAAAENVAEHYTPDTVVGAWMNSPGHRANIMGPYTDIGIGVYTENGLTYFTQIFAAYGPIINAPSAPSNVSVDAVGTTTADISWTPSSSDGGSPIIDYLVTLALPGNPTPVTATSTGSSISVSGLIPGQYYDVTVQARNVVGYSSQAYWNSFTTVTTIPDAPVISVGQVGTRTASIVLDSSFNGGLDITSHEVTLTDVTAGTSRTLTAPGVTPGAAISYALEDLSPAHNYSVTAVAINGNGGSNISATASFETSAEPPTVPQNVTFSTVPTNPTSLTTTWETPSYNGGAEISNYSVYLYDSAGTAYDYASLDANTNSYTFTAIERGKDYYAVVNAVNRGGSSPEGVSDTVNLPFSIPATPFIGVAELIDEQTIKLDWLNSMDDGGTDIISYNINVYENNSLVHDVTVQPSQGLNGTVTLDDSVIDAGKDYRFTITANNSVGSSPESGLSNNIVVPAVVEAPSNVTGVTTTDITDSSALIGWEPSSYHGGAKIEGYNVTVTNTNTGASETHTVSADVYELQLSDLPNYRNYTVTVTAFNVHEENTGTSGDFTTLAGPISEPTNVTVTNDGEDYGKVVVVWSQPTNLGGIPANEVSYTVTLHNETLGTVFEEKEITDGNLMETFEGLPGSSTFYATVTASNPNHNSDAAQSANYSTPTQASAPQNVTVNVDPDNNTQQIVAWEAPETNGSHDIVSYIVDIQVTGRDGQVRSENAVVNADEFSYTYSISGFGDSHVAKVRAFTVITSASAGESAPWISPATSPSKPTNLVGTETTSTTATVTWDAPVDDGGADIAQYRALILDNNDEVLDTILVNADSARTATFTNLTRATTYQFRVVAINESDLTSDYEFSYTTTLPTAPGVVSNVQLIEDPEIDGLYQIIWDAPEDNGGIQNVFYDVTIENGENVTYQSVPITNAYISGINPATHLKVTVQASNPIGSSEGVSDEILNTRLHAPGVATNVIGSINSENKIEATWDTPEITGGGGGNLSYIVNLFNSNNDIIATENVDDLNVVFEDYVVEPVSTYSVSVRAYNQDKESLETALSETFTSNPVEPNAPLTVEDSTTITYQVEDNIPQATVNVKWGVPSFNGGAHITHYVVNALDEDMNNVHSSIATNTNYTFPAGALALNSNYTVNITAVNSVGASEALTENIEVGITTPGIVDAYTVTPMNEDGNKVEFNWGTPRHTGGALIEDIEYRVVVFDDNEEVTSFTTHDNTHTLTVGTQGDLKANTAYTSVIIAINSAGEGASRIGDFTTFMSPPAAPENVSLQSFLTFDNPTPIWEVTWDTPSDMGEGTVQGYEVSIFKKLANDELELIHTEPVDANNTYASITPPAYDTYVHGDVYVARVIVSNEQSQSPYSEPSSDTVYATGYPLAVENLDAVVNEDNTVTLDWDTPIHDGGLALTNYTVMATENDESGEAIINEDIEANTFTTQAFGPKETVRFVVIANNENGGMSAATSVVTLTTNAVAPDDVTNVELDTTSVDGVPTATVTWEAPEFDGGDAITGYIATILDDETNVVEIVETDANVLTATFSNLKYVSHYTVRVSAVNSAGISAPVLSNTILTDAGVPNIPDYVLSYNEAEEALNLQWDIEDHINNGAEITSYDLLIRDITSDEILVDEEIIVGQETSFSYTENTTIGNDYNVRLTATNSVGTSQVNSEDITARNNVPNVPTGHVIFDGTTGTLKWTPTSTNSSTEILYYDVTITGNNVTDEIEVDASETEYVFENLTRGNDYTFTVTAVNAAGASLPLTINETVTVEVPSAPTDVRLRNLEKDTAHLVWLTPADNGGNSIVNYVITVKDANNGDVIDTVTEASKPGAGNVNTTILKGLPLGTQINVTVQASNSAGLGNGSVLSNTIKTAPTSVTVPDSVTAFQFATQVDTSLSQDESMLFAGPHDIAEGAWTYAALYNAKGEKIAEFDWQVKMDGQLAYEIRALKLVNGTYTIGFLDDESNPAGIGSFNIAKADGNNGGGDDDGDNDGGGGDNGGNDGNNGNNNNNGNQDGKNPLFNQENHVTNNHSNTIPKNTSKEITTTNSDNSNNGTIALIGFGILLAITTGLTIRRKKNSTA